MKSKITTTESRLLRVARLFWPALANLDGENLSLRLADVLGLSYGVLIALMGLGWLVAVTDLSLIGSQWPMLLLFLGLMILLRRWPFSLLIEVGPGSYADWQESLDVIVSWSAALAFGPTALWVTALGVVIDHLLTPVQPSSAPLRWNRARSLILDLAQVTAGLIALGLYQRWGGAFPPATLAPPGLIAAMGATVVRFVLHRLCWAPVFVYWARVLREREESHDLGRYLLFVMALPAVMDPFALLATILYARIGVGVYLFFINGVLLATQLANRLSETATRSRQHARELEKLEQLGRAIIQTPVDASRLSGILEEHLPAMFPDSWIDIRLFPDQVIYQHAEGRSLVSERAWAWLRTADEARCFPPEERPVWADARPTQRAMVIAPILEPDSGEPIGGLVFAQRRRAGGRAEELANSLPAIRTLASQIGSALHGAQLYRLEQELTLAGQIQASFLPEELPEIPGWQVAATLEPARQTAGDFYDVIPLPNGRFGILVADVADKGMGAALYMALARTLLRTYALEYHTRPDFAMKVTNRRILMDTNVTMFVTVFYGILDPRTGQLTYCNAGHNPPYILRVGGEGRVQELGKTGMVVGAMPGVSWEQRAVQLGPGDMLVLYTDGVTDAENESGSFFGQERLLEIVQAHGGRPAHEVQAGLLRAVETFTGEASQFDDITLVIAVRDACD
jgi:serine phosphatase RsbU (regulator of sigma subunit)